MARTILRSAFFTTTYVVAAAVGQAQNLVPNPSFEEYSDCPSSYGELYKTDHWFEAVVTPDFYHACDATDIVGVPRNIFGFQQAATGQGYSGIWGYSTGEFGLHELLGIRLASMLVVGETYWASVKVSWTSGYPTPETSTGFASNKLGLFLSTDSLVGESDWLPWPGGAQVYTEEIITDSSSWTTISGHFMAEEPYVFLYVGNVFPNDQTQTLWMQDGADEYSYYYVDDVCLSMDPLYCPMSVGILEGPILVPPVVIWDERPSMLRLTGTEAGTYHFSLFDVTGRLLEHQGFSSSGLQEAIILSTTYDAPAPVILRLQGGGHEWHYKLPPPIR